MWRRPTGRATGSLLDGAEAGKKRSEVAAALDKGVDRIAIGANAGENGRALLVRDDVRLFHADCAATGGFIPCLARIIDPQSDDANPVSMQVNVLGDGMLAAHRGW